ncbi:uncharacterized protein LOC128515698 [Clarias gariepinus]|uniref:uncharacterized protein LOC128515698 n=1 Tax=Clarias gariepinus TaxID=13013 RepID=UPI00234C85E0|nr:uncharacterized protein LOC128515698 [Clarias gariepinus]
MESTTDTPNKRRKPPPNFLIGKESNKESLISCSHLLIRHTMEITKGNDSLLVYMKEMLHSIFFLAYIHDRSLTPSEILESKEPQETPGKHNTTSKLHDLIWKKFPEPFEQYKTNLPTRTPFSILLHMMEILYHTAEEIKKELLILLKKLKFPNPLHRPGSKKEEYYTLESTVICVCFDSGSSSDSTPKKYFGASLSCRKRNTKRIMIDVSCLKTWDEYVSHAVMSFTPEGVARELPSSITFPESVECQAYIRDWKKNVYKERRPCLNCKKLFNLKDADPNKVDHPYGNCAETECLSKLLLNNQYTRKNTRMENHTDLETLKTTTKERLTKDLADVGINMIIENILFYSPM